MNVDPLFSAVNFWGGTISMKADHYSHHYPSIIPWIMIGVPKSPHARPSRAFTLWKRVGCPKIWRVLGCPNWWGKMEVVKTWWKTAQHVGTCEKMMRKMLKKGHKHGEMVQNVDIPTLALGLSPISLLFKLNNGRPDTWNIRANLGLRTWTHGAWKCIDVW